MEGSESYHKITQEADDTYSTDYGWGLYKDDDNSSAKSSKYRRTYTWNERNQLISSVDSNYSTAYVYGQDGQRSNKYTASSETLYFNKMWTLHTDSGNSVYGGQTAKNIYLGETRIVTKLNGGNSPTYQEEYYKQYYYHSDHLGSASLISDYNGDEYQRIEYTPYGETWVEKTSNTGMEYLPYKFTGKEMDEETGLYYYGARYLDPKYSMWISTDPALGDYMSGSSVGCGGIYNPANLDLYHYCRNPIRYTDPNGQNEEDYQRFESVCQKVGGIIGAGKGYLKGAAIGALKALPKAPFYGSVYIAQNAVIYGICGAVDGYSDGTQNGMEFAKSFEDWNGPQRDALNKAYFNNNPFNPNDTADFKRFSDSEAAFHQVPGCDVGKFETLDPDIKGGRPEIVWNYTTNSEVTTPKERGTYNYGHGFMQHGIKDVVPWILLGTGKDDPSTMGERAGDFVKSIPNYLKGLVNHDE